MWEQNDIPGWADALRSTRKDQAQAFLGVPELIAGIQVQPLTCGRLEWLRAYENPFVCGGDKTPAAVVQFLFLVSDAFSFSDAKAKLAAFTETHLDLNFDDACDGIYTYLDRAFLDAPIGGPDTEPLYASSAGMYHALNASYPTGEWTLEKVRDTPMALLRQLVKAADDARGCSLLNRRTADAVKAWGEEGAQAWLVKQRAILEAEWAKNPPTMQPPPTFEIVEIKPVELAKEASNAG